MMSMKARGQAMMTRLTIAQARYIISLASQAQPPKYADHFLAFVISRMYIYDDYVIIDVPGTAQLVPMLRDQ